MKIALLSLMFISTFASAQINGYGYVNGTRIDTINVKYVLIETSTVRAYFDYGQEATQKEKSIKTSDGRETRFYNMAEALNFLDFNGWELFKIIAPDQLLMRKKKESN
jgi:hypothetical protein